MSVVTDLQDRVLAHQFNRQRYGSLIITWLDEAQKFILRQTDSRSNQSTYSFNTVASTKDYSLPADYRTVVGVYNDTLDQKLVPIDKGDVETLPSDISSPTYYFIANNTVTLYPAPDTVYSIKLFYYSMPPTITADVDPVIPADYYDILVDYALWRAYNAEHDFEAASVHREIFETAIARLKGELQVDAQEDNRVVPGAWGY